MKTLAEMNIDELVDEGRSMMIRGEFSKAVDAFTLASEGGASPVMTLLGRGVAHLRLRDYDSAISDFTSVLVHDKDNGRAFRYRGTAHQLRGDNEDAVKDLSRAIMIDPGDGVALFMRGTAFEALGKDEDAGRDIQAALRVSEHGVQQFVDSMGIVRTRTDKWWAEQIGERRTTPAELSEEQAGTLREWFEEEPCSTIECR